MRFIYTTELEISIQDAWPWLYWYHIATYSKVISPKTSSIIPSLMVLFFLKQNQDQPFFLFSLSKHPPSIKNCSNFKICQRTVKIWLRHSLFCLARNTCDFPIVLYYNSLLESLSELEIFWLLILLLFFFCSTTCIEFSMKSNKHLVTLQS